MQYVMPLFRPPSEANSFILQATLGCSWNNCTYCHMYRSKQFSIRPLDELLDELQTAARQYGHRIEKIFVADGDALIMPVSHWVPLLREMRKLFPKLRQVSCYAMASNVNEKSPLELETLRAEGLNLLYMGPESGDEVTLRQLAKQPRPKGASREEDYLFDAHVEAAAKTRAAGMKLSAIFLLGAGGIERTVEHAQGSAKLATAMNPHFLAALTLTVVPDTPLAKTAENLGWELPDVYGLLEELKVLVGQAKPTRALFRTNHASNYLPLGGTLPRDGAKMVELIDLALAGAIPLRDEDLRGL